jgi:hypothetical protein
MALSNNISAIIPVIFAQGLNVLRGNCVMPSMVNNSFSTNAMEKGQVVTIPIPSANATNDVVPGPYAPDSGNSTPTVAQISLDYWREAPFTLTEQEMAQAAAGYPARQANAAVVALAEYVNSTIFSKYKKLGLSTGTPGTAPFASSVDNAVDLKELLTTWKAPIGDRRLVLDTVAMGNALKLGAFAYALNSSDPNVMREGEIGRKYGFNWFEDQQVPQHTAGTITTGLATKASTAVAAGSKTFLATTAASTGACALVAGDIITIAGHPRTYSLAADAAQPAAATDVSLTLNQPLAQALVGSEAITVKASHRVNLAFHADCFGFASRTLEHVAGAEPNPNSMQVADPVSGLTLRLQVREEFHRVRWAFDLLWGVDIVREQLGARLFG